MTVAAVMPLPEGVSELAFAGLLGRRRVPMVCLPHQLPIHAEADFCITGHIEPKQAAARRALWRPPGLLQHGPRFPGDARGAGLPPASPDLALYRRRPPPQEDSVFNQLIHEMVGPDHPQDDPGRAQPRWTRPASTRSRWRSAASDTCPTKSRAAEGPANCSRWPMHYSARASFPWRNICSSSRAKTTRNWTSARARLPPPSAREGRLAAGISTSRRAPPSTPSIIVARGSTRVQKVVIAAAGPVRRNLPVAIDSRIKMSSEGGFRQPPRCPARDSRRRRAAFQTRRGRPRSGRAPAWPTAPTRSTASIVVVDNSDFAARSLNNFLWTTFTRSDPAADVFGIDSFVQNKHWGCPRLGGDRRPGESPPCPPAH